mmetsp:Transcript_90021/g.178989  ORF Transcript_90021/g.178989 Transcript_90021/m.178989 type:complete len:931 (+) Transcript_90021:86-2878(+)
MWGCLAHQIFKRTAIAAAVITLLGALVLPLMASTCCRQAILHGDCWVWAATAVWALGYFCLRVGPPREEDPVMQPATPRLGIYEPIRGPSIGSGGWVAHRARAAPSPLSDAVLTGFPVSCLRTKNCVTPEATRCSGSGLSTQLDSPNTRCALLSHRGSDAADFEEEIPVRPNFGMLLEEQVPPTRLDFRPHEDLRQQGCTEGLLNRSVSFPVSSLRLPGSRAEDARGLHHKRFASRPAELEVDVPAELEGNQESAFSEMARAFTEPLATHADGSTWTASPGDACTGRLDEIHERFLEHDSDVDEDEAQDLSPHTSLQMKLSFCTAYSMLAFFVVVFLGVAVFELVTNLRPLPDRVPLTPRGGDSPMQWPEMPSINESGPLPTPKWQTGPWGHCSTGCGEGRKQRMVRCIFGDEADCLSVQGDAPETEHPCREYSGCQWRADDWGACNTSCGTGVKRRKVLCTNSQISDCFRELWTVPAETWTCTNVAGCRWETHDWGGCSSTCGIGAQHREVVCANGDAHFCEEIGGRPVASRSCQSYTKCRWNASNWSPCSERCGRGNRTRIVQCPSGDASHCQQQDGEAPIETEDCHDTSGCNWEATPWSNCSSRCGQGTQTRSARCLGDDTQDCLAHAAKPTLQQSCTSREACEFTSPWTACSAACGNGHRSRNASCRPADGTSSAPASCELNPAIPAMVYNETCFSIAGCRWVVGPWGDCSNRCGPGEQHRRVNCSSGKTSDCSELRVKPSGVQPCNGTRACSSSSVKVPAVAGAQSAACPCEGSDPTPARGGMLNALVGWLLSFAILYEIPLPGTCGGRAAMRNPAALLLPHAILMAGIGTSIVAASLGWFLMPDTGSAREAALSSSELTIGISGLCLFLSALCASDMPKLFGGRALSGHSQVVWLVVSFALVVFCGGLVALAAHHRGISDIYEH